MHKTLKIDKTNGLEFKSLNFLESDCVHKLTLFVKCFAMLSMQCHWINWRFERHHWWNLLLDDRIVVTFSAVLTLHLTYMNDRFVMGSTCFPLATIFYLITLQQMNRGQLREFHRFIPSSMFRIYWTKVLIMHIKIIQFSIDIGISAIWFMR